MKSIVIALFLGLVSAQEYMGHEARVAFLDDLIQTQQQVNESDSDSEDDNQNVELGHEGRLAFLDDLIQTE